MITITLLLNSISPFSFRKLSNCTLDGLDSQNGYRTLIVSGGKMCYTWVSKLTGKSESEGLNDMNLSLIDEYVYLVLLDNGWTEKRDFLLADRWIEKIEQESNFYFWWVGCFFRLWNRNWFENGRAGDRWKTISHRDCWTRRNNLCRWKRKHLHAIWRQYFLIRWLHRKLLNMLFIYERKPKRLM